MPPVISSSCGDAIAYAYMRAPGATARGRNGCTACPPAKQRASSKPPPANWPASASLCSAPRCDAGAYMYIFSSRISFTQAPHAYTPPNEVRVRVRVRLGLGLAHAYTSPNEADPNLRASANLLQGRSCLMADLNLSSVADSESHSRRSALHMHTPALHMHTPALLCQLSPAGRYAYAYMSCASCLLEPCSPRSAYAYMAALHMHTCPVHPASRALLHGHTPTLARQPLHANPCTPTLARQPPCTGPLHWAEPLYS